MNFFILMLRKGLKRDLQEIKLKFNESQLHSFYMYYILTIKVIKTA